MVDELAIVRSSDMAVDQVKRLKMIVRQLIQDSILVDGLDYGLIPGTGDKKTLLLPGMEKLMRALNAVPEYIERHVIRDYDRPLFHYEYECRLIDSETGLAIPGGRGLGLCTSMESAFAQRWVSEHDVPSTLDKSKLESKGGKTAEMEWAINQAKTDGKYGKPASYWKMFKDALADGSAERGTRTYLDKKTGKDKTEVTWAIDTTLYHIPNPDIFDQINAIMKRGKKRALGDAIKGAANVSEFFTVDLEDLLAGAPNDDEDPSSVLVSRDGGNQLPSGSNPPNGSGAAGASSSAAGNGGSTNGAHWGDQKAARSKVQAALKQYKFTTAEDYQNAFHRIDPKANKLVDFALDQFPTEDEFIALIHSTFGKKSNTAPKQNWDELSTSIFDNFERESADVLKELGKRAWNEFGTTERAWEAVLALARTETWTVICNRADYNADQHYFRFLTAVGDIRSYGHDSLIEVVGLEYFQANHFEDWETKAFPEAETIGDLRIEWEQKDGYMIVIDAIEAGGTLLF